MAQAVRTEYKRNLCRFVALLFGRDKIKVDVPEHMNKNEHDTDDFFKAAYQQFEEEPMVDVWQKINAGLDKKDADSDRKKYVVWRRAAIVLLLIITGFVLFDSRIFKTGSGHSNDNTIAEKYLE